MQEISLTGATLLGDTPHGTNTQEGTINHNYTAATSAGMDPLLTSSSHAHTHSHATDNNNNNNDQLHPAIELSAKILSTGNNHDHKDCCGTTAPTIVQPLLSLQIPISQLVQQTTNEILKACFQIVRMGGTLELLQQIVTEWKNTQQGTTNKEEESTTTPTSHADFVTATLRNAVDASGYSLLHWATKRTTEEFVQYCLHELNCPPTRPSTDETQMTPLHWMCTVPSRRGIPMLRAVLEHHQTTDHNNTNNNTTVALWQVADSTGCTPLLLAAQHGHVETVAYILQVAPLPVRSAVDHSGDSAIHWAAYKGSIHVLGLLAYEDYQPQLQHFWTTPDAYGQMPLHLAALRGHTTACRYILRQLKVSAGNNNNHKSSKSTSQALRTVLLHKDSNGRTPLALALHKEKYTVAATLQHAQDQMEVARQAKHNKNQWKSQLSKMNATKVRSLARRFCSVHAWKTWLGVPGVGMDDLDESPQFPFYYVWIHIVLHYVFYFSVFYPVTHVGAGVLWDLMGLHLWNWSFMLLTTGLLYKTTTTSPGRLEEGHPRIAQWRALYQQTLQHYAHGTLENAPAPHGLCHTCHIARPARSKHDRFTGACIEVFDHHCPFVGTTVGLYNYGYFYLFCVCMTLYFGGFWTTLIVYWMRMSSTPWMTLLYGLFLGIHGTFPVGMVLYHSQLLWLNLTTNEHIHTAKYDYFWQVHTDSRGNTTRKFWNPWNRGGFSNLWTKIMEPSEALYMLPQDAQQQPLLQNDPLQHVV